MSRSTRAAAAAHAESVSAGISSQERTEPFTRWLPALAVAVVGLLSFRRLDDFDTWWHLAAGRWIAENRSIPATDVLSFTVPDHAWTNLQWLYDLALYALYRAGGANLLVAATVLCFVVAFVLLARNLARSCTPEAVAVLLAWVAIAAGERYLIRPEMVTFVLLAWELLVLAGARATQGRHLWQLVPIMVLWVNMHALFVIGALVIVTAVAGAWIAESGLVPARWRDASAWPTPVRKRLTILAAVALLATLANPYGIEGVLFPLELLSRIDGSDPTFQVIGEFRSPFSGYFPTLEIGAYQAFFMAATAVVAAAAALELTPPRRKPGSASRPRFDLAGLMLFVALAYLSLLARRNVGIFVVGVTPFVAECIATLVERVRLVLAAGTLAALARARRAAVAAVAVMLAVLAALTASNRLYAYSGATHEFGAGLFTTNFPIHAADFVRDHALPGPIYNDLTAGGYLAWTRPTGHGVYIDGRLEVYDAEFVGAYLAGLGDVARWQQEADRLGAQSVLLFHRWANRHGLIRWLLRNPNWALVYHDEVAVVFVRAAGNEAKIQSARTAFPERLRATQERLAAPVSRWQRPVERMTALQSYAQLMETLGELEEAVALYERSLALGLPAADELSTRLRMTAVLAYRGRTEEARLHLQRARELDPADPRIAPMQRALGSGAN